MKSLLKICSVIDIGSDTVKMGIFESKKDEIYCLDRLNYPVNLGHEIFNFGQVTFSSLYELCSILDRFKVASASFGANEIHVVSTTVMREAGNSSLISDRIQIQNGLNVSILSDSEEKSLIYSNIIERINGLSQNNGKATIAYVGSGSLGIAYYENGYITKSFNIATGSLKLHDILGTIKNEMSDYYVVVEEYLHSVIKKVDIEKCDLLIITGSEIERLALLCNAENKNGLPMIASTSLNSLYMNLRSTTAENIAVRLNIDEETANVFSTSLSIYHELMSIVSKNAKIIAPSVDIEEIIASHILIPGSKGAYKRHITESSLKHAKNFAKKYMCNEAHYTAVSRIVCDIFDKTKKIHGLDDRYRNILQIASILHSCGQYINIKQRAKCSFDLIKNMDIYGMTHEDILLTAFVSSYNEFNIPDNDDSDFRILNDKKRIVIAKLVAMFRLANSLDKSQKNKMQINKIQAKDDILIINATATENAVLEKWAFNECADFFQEIFGIRPELTIKSILFE